MVSEKVRDSRKGLMGIDEGFMGNDGKGLMGTDEGFVGNDKRVHNEGEGVFQADK